IAALQASLSECEAEAGRWREAAKEEAAAGSAVAEEMEEMRGQLLTLEGEAEKWQRAAEEAQAMLTSRDELAAAAVAAREAAERSLRAADRRVAELRERVEELQQQLEDETTHRSGASGAENTAGCAAVGLGCQWEEGEEE
ncbi:unnamed protein product, partial [Closterium sp. NIES-53]